MLHAIYLELTDFIYTYWIVNAAKLSLKDKFKQSWYTSIQNSPKTLVYRCFKETFEFKKKCLESVDHIYLFDFFKLQTSNRKLPIECGRW